MMTAEQNPEIPADLVVVAAPPAEAPAEPAGTRTAFSLPQPEGEAVQVLWAVKPKGLTLMTLGESLNAAEDDPENEAVVLHAYRRFMKAAVEPDSADLIWVRLADPDDFLDAPHMKAMTRLLMEKWTARPTVRPSGSARLPRTTGRASTGSSRAKGKTQKT